MSDIEAVVGRCSGRVGAVRLPVTQHTLHAPRIGQGLGKETARQLHAMNANIILACRDVGKGEAVADELRRRSRVRASRANGGKELSREPGRGGGGVSVMELDVASFASIERFASQIESSGSPVHVLINNAGIMAPKFERVGFLEKTFVTNHLGPFALTLRLLPALARSGTLAQPSRVVNVSSRLEKKGAAQFFAPEGHEDSMTRAYSPFKAYGTSKLANIMFSNELERLCLLNGVHITANSVTPGMIPGSDLGRDMAPWVLRAVLKPFGWLLCKSTSEGALTTVFAAAAPELAAVGSGGRFLDVWKPGLSASPSAQSGDADAAARLWRQSVKASGVSCSLLEGATDLGP